MTEYKDSLTKSAADYRMKNKTLTMMTARAAMTLLALFCILGGANAQKTLPYEYGFENINYETEGWSRVDCEENSTLGGGSSMEGIFMFYFTPNNNHDQYLISPELESGSAISVLFWYTTFDFYKNAYFEVGYSTTTKDISAFTWDQPRSHESPTKHPYSNTYPAGTKYIAIKYCKSSNNNLSLDAFRFTKSAPVSLPYEFSVEKYPEVEGWSRVDCENSTDMGGGGASDAHTGKSSFLFSPDDANTPQYLISPEFSGDTDILMSFWYTGGGSFQVGYSTTTKDVSAFTWKEQITATYVKYQQYQGRFSAGVKYIAFKYSSRAAETFLDDFSFEAGSEYSQPTGLTMADLTSNTATITWTKPASGVTGYYYQYRKNGASDWGTERSVSAPSASLSGLKPGTGYNFRVRACYGNDKFSNYATINFSTDCDAMSMPYTESFEDGLGCWTYEGRNIGASNLSGHPHEGRNGVIFVDYPDPQYLISPEIDSNVAMTLSFWYWKNKTDNDVSFQVGYSTTTNAVSAFTWGEKVSAVWGWEQYENDFPAGTKYVAIKYVSTNNDDQLSLDDFSFTKVSHYGTWLASCGNDKLAIIQTLHNQLGIDLTAAKALAGSAPCYVLTNVSEEEAEALARALTIRGATAYAKDMKNSSGIWQPDSGEGYVTCLLDCGDDKMAIIKTLKEMLGLDLKVAKDLADAAPCVVLETESEEEALALANALNAKGATAYMKDLSVISKALPYTYGFENNALEREGWSLVDCTEGTGIEDNVSHNGNYIFGFLYTTNPPQYLISPQFDGTTGMAVSFYYKNQMDDYPETFQVGYSTTNRSIDAFTWGNKVTANDEDRWRQFKTYFPIGTKYVAIKYTSYDECYLMLDDFSFEAVDGITLDVTKDNSDIFDANKGQVVDVKFKGLTLEADKWNALCLPFDMTAEQIAASPLAGATIHEYVGTDPEGTSATITLSRECTEIEAGFPNVVKFSGKNIVNPTFGTVYIPEHLRGESIGNNRSFIRGTLVPVELEAGDRSKLYWHDEHLYRPESATTVDAFSFYFELDGTGYDNVTTFNVDFGDRLLGDVNGDGAVNIADAVCIVNHVVGKANSTFVEAAADVNNDGVVDIADAVKIVNLVVGKVETLSREQ